MLISIVGTLVTDNLVDNLGVSLITTTLVFTGLLSTTFAAWHASERTLSIHEATTTRREAFYWLAILFTFALGTAAGDLVAEQFALGYMATGLLFGMIIASITFGYYVLKLDASSPSGLLISSRGHWVHPSATCCHSQKNMAAWSSARSSQARCSLLLSWPS